MAERTYSEQEVQDLLERAAELQMQIARGSESTPGLTLSELEQIAEEAGLDPTFVKQAATELDDPAHDLFESSTGRTSTHVFVERWIPGELTPEAWEDIVVELRQRYDSDLGSAMGMPGYGIGTTEKIGRTVEWRHTSMTGVSTRLMMRERGGGVRVRLSRRVGIGSELTEALAYGSLLSAFAGVIGGAVASSPAIGVLFVFLALLVSVPLILYADRAWRRKQHRELAELADRVAALTSRANSEAAPASELESAASEMVRAMDPSEWEDVDTSRSGGAPLADREKHRTR